MRIETLTVNMFQGHSPRVPSGTLKAIVRPEAGRSDYALEFIWTRRKVGTLRRCIGFVPEDAVDRIPMSKLDRILFIGRAGEELYFDPLTGDVRLCSSQDDRGWVGAMTREDAAALRGFLAGILTPSRK